MKKKKNVQRQTDNVIIKLIETFFRVIYFISKLFILVVQAQFLFQVDSFFFSVNQLEDLQQFFLPTNLYNHYILSLSHKDGGYLETTMVFVCFYLLLNTFICKIRSGIIPPMSFSHLSFRFSFSRVQSQLLSIQGTELSHILNGQ